MEITKKILDDYNQNSLYNTIGICIEEAMNGKARAQLEPKAAVCWPIPGQPHGGVLSVLFDTTMAWAVISEIEYGHSCTTISLDIDFTSPPKGDFFSCQAVIMHRTRRFCFLRGDIYDQKGRLIAMGQGNFGIVKMDFLPKPN
ncbi:PaaI family thioesterase [Thermodesulfobacteriota bacterium]